MNHFESYYDDRFENHSILEVSPTYDTSGKLEVCIIQYDSYPMT